jgi:dUTPase/transposase InsO family protein
MSQTNEGPRRSNRLSSKATRSHSPQQQTNPPNQIQTSTNNDNLPLPNSPPPEILTTPPYDTDNDNDLSFRSTQGSDDLPFQSIPHTSTQPSLLPPVTNPNTELHNLLQQLSSRINNIEITNNDRIDSLEKQILQSQSNFQQQLLQSQQSLANIIKSSIQEQSTTNPTTTTNNNTHSNHTSQHNLSSTSIPTTTHTNHHNHSNRPPSCDPPTNHPTITFQPTQKPTSPDPPESTYNVHSITNNNYTTPKQHSIQHTHAQPTQRNHHNHNSIRPSHEPSITEQNQYNTSTPTFTPSPTTRSSFHPVPPPAPNPPTQIPTIIVQAPAHTPKLILDSYKKDNGYLHFKNMSFLTMSADPSYSDCVKENENGDLILNQTMSAQLSKTLFCATLKALGRNASEVISTTSSRDANAIKLWTQLDNHFLRSTTSHILKSKLKKDFDTMKKEPNEPFSSYITKFESCLHKLRHNQINPGTSSDIAYRFLESLALPKVFNSILMNMDDDSSWALGNDLRTLMYKAEDHYQKYQQIYATNNCPLPSSPSPPPQRPRNPRPSPTPTPTPPRPRPSPAPAPNPPVYPPTNPLRPASPFVRNEPEIQRIRALLQQSSNPTSTLHRLHQSQPTTCSLHSGANHPLISCAILRNICNQTNHFDVLNNTRNDLNLPPMPSSGLLALPPRPRNNPPTTSQRVANPYLPSPSPAHQPPPLSARHVFDSIDEDQPGQYIQEGDPILFDDPEVLECPLSAPPGFDNDCTDSHLINHSNYPIDPYLTSSYPCSILNPSHVVPRKRVRFHLPSTTPPPHVITCRYTSNSPSPYQQLTSTHPNVIRAVCDSGASHTMTSHLHLFNTITYFNTDSPLHQVVMGDDTTKLQIKGYGYIHFLVHGRSIRLFSYYVPDLGTTLLSIKQHMSIQGCYFHAEADHTVLAFPTFQIHPRVSSEIDMLLTPLPCSPSTYDFNEQLCDRITPSSQSSCSHAKSTARISVISPTISKYISEPNLQAPFTHTIHFRRLLPTSKLPTKLKSSTGGFSASTVTTHTILPGTSQRLPTGLHVTLPPNVTLHSLPNPTLNPMNLSIIDNPISVPASDELYIRICNNGTAPIVIPAFTPIAQFLFRSNGTTLVPFHAPTPPRTTHDTSPPSPPPSTSYQLTPSQLIVSNGSNTTRYRVRRASRPPPTRLTVQHPSAHSNDPASFHNSNITPVTSPLDMHHPPIDPKNHSSPSPSLTSPRSPLPSDSTNAALPKVTTMTRQCLLQSIGYRKPDSLLSNMRTLASTPISISRDSSPKMDPGETATMHSSRRNTTPSVPPSSYSDTWHLDIGYGPCTAIGGIRYTLLAVDKATRYKFIYGLKDLKSSLLKAMKQFVIDCGVPPKLLRTDFDHKIMGGKVAEFLRSSGIPIQASPPYRQHQNGLVESHWQTVVSMARNWLTSSLLPSTYWFFAVKRASEVCNILPTRHLSSVSTPFELVHKKKVDYRLLFPMFSTSYIKYRRAHGSVKNKWTTQTLKCIVVGTCRNSDGLLFYHPPSKQVITCGDGHRFDTFSPSGPQFNEKFDGSFTISSESSNQSIHRPHSFEISKKVFYKDSTSSQYIPALILTQPHLEDTEPYTVQACSSGAIVQLLASDLFDHDPSSDPTLQSTNLPIPHLPWIQHNAVATLFLSDRMKTPKQGFLKLNAGEWSFQLGRIVNKTSFPLIKLPNFTELAESLIYNKKLFPGRKTNSFVLNARHSRATSNVLSHLIHCRKVSAANLHQMQAPTLLNHAKLHPEDKATWDAAYMSEYNGLVDIKTWDTITEDQYQSMKHLYQGIMPTMAISTIKYDGDGNPSRAKYRIVALGNLDPHLWTKSDCFAPVLSQLELRFLTALAVRKKCIPKTGDVTQAFCQSCLPPDEHYICRPPPGCPITPPHTYWRLKKTLYGLKRSPRHFYELARKILLDIGLTQHPTSPCIFSGSIIPGEPPLYLGLYVDDFIYFSESAKVESMFEQKFGDTISTDFNGQIGYFLGINFTCKRQPNGDVNIHLGQEAFVENLCQIANLDNPHVAPVRTPYRSGCPVDTIPKSTLPPQEQAALTHKMQVLLGSLTWLSISTRPDIATITNLLAQYTTKATLSHLNQVKRVIKYLRSTKTLGISFNSNNNETLQSYVKFPIPSGITSLCDANWGPQDQSRPVPNEQRTLDLFKSRSLSGFLIYFGGPVHWVSKRQSITARSSAEAEIYATDECTKCLLHLHQIVDGLDLTTEIMSLPTTIYNDNSACVSWSRNLTTKGLRHIQMRENAVRESFQNGFIIVKHISGKINLSDMFTKEDKDTPHFLEIRNVVMSDRNPTPSKL